MVGVQAPKEKPKEDVVEMPEAGKCLARKGLSLLLRFNPEQVVLVCGILFSSRSASWCSFLSDFLYVFAASLCRASGGRGSQGYIDCRCSAMVGSDVLRSLVNDPRGSLYSCVL